MAQDIHDQPAGIPELVDVTTPPGYGLSLRAYLAIAGTAPALVALAVFIAFMPVLMLTYAFSDDYTLLWMTVSHTPSRLFGASVFDAYASGGRPIAGMLYSVIFWAAGTIEHLWFARLFAVVTIAALALLVHWALVRAHIDNAVAALVAVLMCTTPAFQMSASWAALSAAPLAAVLAGSASVLSEPGAHRTRRRTVLRMATAATVLVVAFLIYQPAAMFYWIMLAIAVVGAKHEPQRALRTTLAHLGVGGTALAVATVATRISTAYLSSAANNIQRTTLTSDPIGKANWFLTQPLYRSLNLSELTLSPWVAVLVAAVAVGGVALWLVRRSSQPVLYLAIGAALIPLAFLPSLVVRENVGPIRTQIALTSLVALYCCLGALGIWVNARQWLRPRVAPGALAVADRVARAVAVAFVAASALSATSNVTNLIAVPQATELRIVRSQLAGLPTGTMHIDFFATPGQAGMTRLVVGDEFGLPSTAKYYALGPLALLLMREGGQLPAGAPLPFVETHEPTLDAHPAGAAIIDARVLQLLR